MDRTRFPLKLPGEVLLHASLRRLVLPAIRGVPWLVDALLTSPLPLPRDVLMDLSPLLIRRLCWIKGLLDSSMTSS